MRVETYEGYLVLHVALKFGHMHSIFLLLGRVILDGGYSLSLSLSLSLYIYIYIYTIPKNTMSNELNILVKFQIIKLFLVLLVIFSTLHFDVYIFANQT